MLELALRFIGALGDIPLYYSDSRFEYAPCPNQTMKRLGNKIHYNSYSQRSDEPDTSKTIIWGLSDAEKNESGVVKYNDSDGNFLTSKKNKPI